jgi:AraC-like DNA-binding protein
MPKDFLAGLPDPPSLWPESILLFCQHRAFDQGSGATHHRFVFIANLKTSGSVIIDDSVYPLEPGEAVLVMPYQFHHYANFAASDLLWFFVTFELPSMEPLLPLRDRRLTLSPLQQRLLEEAARHYRSEGKNVLKRLPPPAGQVGAMPHLVGLLLQEALQGVAAEKGVTRSSGPPVQEEGRLSSARLLSQVAAFVHTHLHEPIQAGDVAKHVGLSVSHLRGRFKRSAGVGVGAYIRRCRLHRASGMMRASEDSLTEICVRCGFDSLYSFSRTFKREMGMTPTEYREGGATRRPR